MKERRERDSLLFFFLSFLVSFFSSFFSFSFFFFSFSFFSSFLFFLLMGSMQNRGPTDLHLYLGLEVMVGIAMAGGGWTMIMLSKFTQPTTGGNSRHQKIKEICKKSKKNRRINLSTPFGQNLMVCWPKPMLCGLGRMERRYSKGQGGLTLFF